MTKKRKVIIAVLVVVALAAAVFALVNEERLKKFVKKQIANNIILVQKIRKSSDILFVGQQLFGRNRLSSYQIEIKDPDWQKLNNSLPRGNYTELEKQGLLSGAISGANKLFVPAKFIYNDQKYDVEVRYRGASYVHWFYPKKSWLVKFKDSSPLGIDKINLIIPSDRGYLGELLSNYRAKKLGLITPQSGFVNFAVNGIGQGVYLWAEDWSAEMLAENKRNEAGCLFGSTTIWKDNRWQDLSFSDLSSWKEYTNNCVEQDFSKLQALFDLLRLDDNLFYQQVESIIDVKQVMVWDALGRLQGSKHGQPYNLRLYFDKQTGKFEPLPWDFGLGPILAPEEQIDAFYNELIARLLKNNEYYNYRNQVLYAYTADGQNLTDDLLYYDNLFAQTRIAFYQDSLENESNLEFRKKVKLLRQAIVDNYARINNFLGAPEQLSFVYLENKGAQKSIRISSVGPIPVYIEEVECADKCPDLKLIYDKNNNGRLDSSDIALSTSLKKKDVSVLDKIPLASTRSLLAAGEDRETVTAQVHRFFISSRGAQNFVVSNIIVRNYLTGKQVNIRFSQIDYD